VKRALVAGVLLLVALVAICAHWLWPELGEAPAPPAAAISPAATPEQVARGAYLALAGDCMACHTERGGVPYAGGRGIVTPFGTFHSPNITPDAATGIGAWSADDFWRALHDGRSRDGSLLYPSFPYTNFTKVARTDADDLFAYLRSLPPVRNARRSHALRFPYEWRALLALWRLLYFRPGEYQADATHDAQWNRGAYLVEGLGHCSACHESRNALGGTRDDSPAGGLVLNWYAPSLRVEREAGVAQWAPHSIVELLKTGTSGSATTVGPMAEVVFQSLQHLRDDDLQAMATFLASMPAAPAPEERPASVPDAKIMARGSRLYDEHCQQCHGAEGQGRPPAGPALAGNRDVTMDPPINPIRIALYGGYPPGTAGNPRPFGMPPFSHQLGDEDLAAVLTFARASFGNHARAVTDADVARHRAGPLW
jgi:mono/diheme cytochrome c family protein